MTPWSSRDLCLLVWRQALHKPVELLRCKFHTVLPHLSNNASCERCIIKPQGNLDDVAEKIRANIGVAFWTDVAQEVQDHYKLFRFSFTLKTSLHEGRACEFVWWNTSISHSCKYAPCFSQLRAAHSCIYDCVVR